MGFSKLVAAILLSLATSVSSGAGFPTPSLSGDDDAYRIPVTSEAADSGVSQVVLEKNKPEIRFQKWNDEVDVGLSYAGIDAKASRDPATGMTRWVGADSSLEAYPLKAKEGETADGFEIQAVINKKPATNEFHFPIDGYQNLNFFLQKPLNEEPVPPGATSCSATECRDAQGTLVASRPENVVGSYAVYHKTKQDHELGGMNYATGKAFHIFRPKAIDAAGKEAWSDLSYENGVLAVTVPQDFLDTATYPVKVDPTFGYSSIGASTVSCNSSVCSTVAMVNAADRYTASAGDTITKFSLYGFSDAGTQSMGITAYNYTGGHPGSRLLAGQSISFTTTPGWFDSGPVSQALSAGSTYVLAFSQYSAGTGIDVAYDSVANAAEFEGTFGTTFPATWTAGALDVYRISAYATYTTSGGGGGGGPTTSTLIRPANNLGLVGYWPFNEGTSTKAGDFSGTGKTGTLSGSPLPSWTNGKFGGALNFDGSSQYLAVPDDASLHLTTLTVTGWVKLSTSGTFAVIASKSNASANAPNYECGISDTGEAYIWNGTQGVAGSTVLTPNVWHYISCVAGGGTAHVYVDGIEDVSGSFSVNTGWDSNPLYFGVDFPSARSGDNLFLNGNLDDIRLYSRALSATEISALYKNGISGATRINASSKTLTNGSTLGSGLIGLWTFDGGDTPWSSATVGKTYDGSGNTNTGTLVGMNRATSTSIGKYGQALTFSGNQYVALTDTGNTLNATDGTVSIWYKSTNDVDNYLFSADFSSVSGNYFDIELGPSSVSLTNEIITLYTGNAGANWIGGYTTANRNEVFDGNWHNIVVTTDSSTHIYLDGVAKTVTTGSGADAGTFTASTNIDRFTVGAQTGGGVYFPSLYGSVDDVRVYNRTLSATEVMRLYKLGVVSIHQ